MTGINNLGKYVQYKDKKWRILYEDDELGNGKGAQLISAEVLNADSINLMCFTSAMNENDWTKEEIINEADIIENDGNLSNEEKTIYTYNHSVELLNKLCQNAVTVDSSIVNEVRSVGSNPLDPFNYSNDKMFYKKMVNSKW